MKKRQEVSGSVKNLIKFILSLRCYILTKYDISHISNIIYWPYNILKGNNCHPETSASVDGASGIFDPASRNFLKDKQPPKSVELHLIIREAPCSSG